VVDAQYLGVPDINGWIFWGMSLAAFVTTFLGSITGAAGGLVLLAIMAIFFPPAILVPVHTVVQLGVGSSRALLMWRYVMRGTLLPFALGSALGAALGAQIFVSLPSGVLQGTIGLFILTLAWLPKFARLGSENKRFAAVGFAATFLGVFVSATGTIVAPFVASASPDRRNHAATLGSLMTIVHVMKLIAFGALGVAAADHIPLMAVMIAGCVLGNWFGHKALDRMPERLFRIFFQALLTVLALRLLWVGATESGLF
jgi:uncharacterized protein